MAKQKKEYMEFFVLFGLMILFFNNVVAFLKNLFGFDNVAANFVIFLATIILVYRFTPWLDAMIRGLR